MLLWMFLNLLNFSQGQGKADYIAHINYYGVQEGLSHREVFDIHQDQKGFIWLATKYGLNRFDGRSFKWWTREKNGLTFNENHRIVEDASGMLWVYATPNWYINFKPQKISLVHSISGEVYDLQSYFGNQLPINPDEIISLIATREGALYFTTIGDELLRYHPDEGFNKQKIPGPGPFYLLDELPEATLLAAAGPTVERISVLVEIDPVSGQIVRKMGLATTAKGLRLAGQSETGERIISARYEESAPKLFQLDQTGLSEIRNPNFISAQASIFPFWDNDIFCDSRNGQYWFKGNAYLNVIHPELGFIYDFGEKEAEMARADVHKVFFDRNGLTWLATANGLYQIELRPNRFSRYLAQDYDDYNVLQAYSCRGIWTDQDQLYVNTYKGRMRLDLHSAKVEKLPFIPHTKNDGSQTLLGYYPLAILKDVQDDLWFGDFALLKKNLKTNDIQAYSWESAISNEPNIWSLYRDIQGKLWVGADHGLAYIDSLSKRIVYDSSLNEHGELANSYIHTFVQSKQGHVWLGTTAGLYAWHYDKGIIGRWWSGGQKTAFIPAENVLHIHEDPSENGWLWLATGGGGLILLNTESEDATSHYQQFTIADGLSNNFLYSVYADQKNHLWMSSDYGIIQFDKKTYQAKAYLPKDGITHHEFNRISHFQADDGSLYFGSLNGVTAFHPNDFYAPEDTFEAEIHIIGLQQFDAKTNQLIDFTEELLEQEKITLEPNARFFQLEFAMLDYSQPDLIRYAWKLKGQQEQWTYTQENIIRVGGLPSGDYELIIRGQAADGQWSRKEIHLPIEVLQPFYLQIQFWFWLSLILLLGSFIFIRLRTRQLKNRQAELEKLVLNRTEIIRQQAEELMQLDQMKSRFFANVSHELRTPLTLILGPLSASLKDKSLNKKLTTYLKLALQNGQKLLQMVNEILDLSKMEAGKLTLEEKPVILLPFLRRLISQFESHAQHQQVELTFSFEPDPYIQIQLDVPKFEIIFNNLLSNAIKFTPKGGKIQVHLKDLGNALLLEVSDTGKGIHPEDLPHIFNRFYQTKREETAQGGTGIGLAVSKEYSQLFGGDLTVESTLEQGSSFRFRFPMQEVFGAIQEAIPAALEGEMQIPEANVSLSVVKDQKAIVLVEDNHSLRQYIRLILGEKYPILTTENGQAGLNLLNSMEQAPSLIISDVMMPVLDGFQMLEKLKSDDRWRHIPVIMLTARAELRDKLKALRMGVDDYLIKPFEEEELLARVANLVEHAQKRDLIQEDKKSAALQVKLSQADARWLEAQEQLLQAEIANSLFSSPDWAEHAALSERQLQRKIKALTGLSPHQYLTEMRLGTARKLLEDGAHMTVAEVAYAVGFSNPQSFSRSFRKRFGKNPSAYFLKA